MTGAGVALFLAALSGDHLCRRLAPAGQGLRTWPTHGDVALTGFAHGAAGIAYALARLHAVTGDPSYARAAVAGIAYERWAFRDDDGNWPDLRPAPEGSRSAVKWCHGAPGVVLGRAGCLGLALDGLEKEIEIGLRTTKRAYLQDADFLRCGNLGRAEAPGRRVRAGTARLAPAGGRGCRARDVAGA
jgi:hypothetical protein